MAWILGGSALVSLWSAPAPALAADPSTAQQCNAAYEKAQVLRRARKLRAARDELLTCSQSKCPGAITADCGPWLKEVETSMPSVVIVARDASGNDVPAVRVSVDGVMVAPRLTGVPIDVDPGEHVFTFEPEQGQRVDQTLLVNVGEKNRLVQVPIRPAAKAAGGDRPADKPSDQPPPDEGRRPGSIVPGVVVGALGVASLGASVGLYVSAKGQINGLRSTCAPSCSSSQVDPIKTKGIASDVTFGVGLAGLGVGALLVILELTGKPAPAPAPASAARAVIVAPTPGGLITGFSGQF